MAYSSFLVFAVLGSLLSGCTGAQPGTVNRVDLSKNQPTSQDSNTEPSKDQNQTSNPAPNAPVTAFTLTDAKGYCASCHGAQGSGSRKWSTATGTEADWKAVAVKAKATVENGSMPPNPLSAENKKKMIAYLDKLIASGGANNGSTSEPTTPNTEALSVAEASALCTSCHAAGKSMKSKPLATLADWNNRDIYCRAKLYEQVENGEMPQTGALQDPAKTKMLNFIKSLAADPDTCE